MKRIAALSLAGFLSFAVSAVADEPPVKADPAPPKVKAKKKTKSKAKTPGTADTAPKPKKALKINLGGGLEMVTDDNVFKLNEKKKALLEAVRGDPDNDVNNRFSRMESNDDLLLHGYGRIDFSWKGVAGKNAMFRIEPGAYGYLTNTLKSYNEIKAKFVHETWTGGDVYLKAGFIPRMFKRNFFVGGIDSNADGNIAGAERVYKHAVLDEFSSELGLDSRIYGPLSGRIYGMWTATDYNEPFNNRDLQAGGGGVELTVQVTKWFWFGGTYEIEAARSDDDSEAVLIDETVFGELDGIAGLDTHAQISTPVDRSYVSHAAGPTIRIRPLSWATLSGFYTWKRKRFGSSEAFDQSYNDRTDVQDKAGAELKIDLAPKTKFWIAYQWTRQTTDRPNDPDDISDDYDYRRNEVTIGIEVYF